MDVTYYTDVGSPNFNRDVRGSCVGCKLDVECNLGLPLTPICLTAGADAGSCGPCATNAQCAGLPGKNCQASGQCKSCTSNLDCGLFDGGENTLQPVCDVASGICVDPFICTDNPSCVGHGGNNCQLDKSCVSCTSNANCGLLDGGEVVGQQVCNTVSGICGTCSTNAQCAGTLGGNNCQADGKCKSCLLNSDCGSLDGGEAAGQSICNIVSGICESACVDNVDCANKGAGKNCQADGTCRTCTTSLTCGLFDGGETPGQTTCNTDLGLCTTPFTCTDNESCDGNGGHNCQIDGSCLSCTAATCGLLDGGETKIQPNCHTPSRLCIDPCTTNAGCIGTQGNNCQVGGLCRTCLSNLDCITDGGEISGQSICNVGTGICESPCASNAACPNGQNCQADGTCQACKTTADCGILDGGEVISQPICFPDTGLCGLCTENADCPSSAPMCGLNGFCFHCNPIGCGDFPATPNCRADTGFCVNHCTEDVHCAADDCNPYCNVDKGCCVECTENKHCPHQYWESTFRNTFTTCSQMTDTCVAGCAHDIDCSGETPACSATESACVGCLYDSQCTSEDEPFCDVAAHVCTSDGLKTYPAIFLTLISLAYLLAGAERV